MCSLVLSKLDYCNSLLSSSPQYLIQLFQKVQNTAARITLRAQELNLLHPDFVPFTDYLYKNESNTSSALFAARISLRAPRAEHTSPLIRSLHWLATCTKENQAQGLLYLLYYTDWCKSEVHVRTCQCINSIQMPALIIR